MQYKQKITNPDIIKFGENVYCDKIYKGQEPLKVTGKKETSFQVEYDPSGGTAYVIASEWIPIENLYIKRAMCPHKDNGTCKTEFNHYCKFPKCEPRI